jgi:hypothetical protein
MCYNYYEKHDVSLVKLVRLFLADGSTADSVQEGESAPPTFCRERKEKMTLKLIMLTLFRFCQIKSKIKCYFISYTQSSFLSMRKVADLSQNPNYIIGIIFNLNRNLKFTIFF